MTLVTCFAVAGCSSPVTVATFNIRMFPRPDTDHAQVAKRIAAVDASIMALQEIGDGRAMAAVLADASQRGERDYRLLLGPCGGDNGRFTTAIAYDAETWSVVEHIGYPDMLPDGHCGRRQPGTLGVFRNDQGKELGVLSMHLPAHPYNFDSRKVQWGRVLERVAEAEARHDAPILALGDANSTGFRGEPAEERPFVEGLVEDAGRTLPTAELSCTEYWRPPRDDGPFRPSVLDHVVAPSGWKDARVWGLCERLDCDPTDADEMDPEFVSVSDHCPVTVVGKL